MPLIPTHLLEPGQYQDDQIYNGLDTMVTFEVMEELERLFTDPPLVYGFSRALQGPILEIMLRGFAVDETERQQGIRSLRKKLLRLEEVLDRYSSAIWDRPLNPRSHPQLKAFFYGAMRLPEIWISDKGQRKLSFRREVLEKIDAYFHARPIISCILAIREISKRLEVLETEVSPDGRLRTSYNIAGTETGRLSSSADAFGDGTNLQNITPDLRKMFVSDPGWKLCVIDLEQAESREVGWLLGILFDDWSYLDACEGGDLHTVTAKLIWPTLPWTGDPKLDREIAEQPFYRHFSYRDMSKRGGHGTTYYGTPWTMARHLKVPVQFMEAFQLAFLGRAFPGISRYHRWVAQEIQTTQSLTTPFGFTRHFFGRPNDDTTLREGIAFSPQSTTAHRTNLGLLRHWVHFKSHTQLLAQTHDSITFQYRVADEAWLIPQAVKLMEVEMTHKGRSFIIPGEAKVGWNWMNHHKPDKPTGKKNLYNPNGLVKWKGSDNRVQLLGIDRPIA